MQICHQVIGKCIDVNSRVLTKYGYKKAKELKTGDFVYSMNRDTRKAELKRIIGVEYSKKQAVKITSRNNESIIISPEHRMLTQRGYIPAKDLTVNDYLYQLRANIDGNEPINEDELKFITAMIFEGYCRRSKQSFTGENNLMTQEFLKVCKNLDIDVIKRTKKGNSASSYCLKNKNAVDLMKKYAILNHLCYDKRLPKEFFNLPLSQKYIFLGIMLATDGYFEQKNRDCGIALANELLIDDIKLLLQTMGIHSKKHYKKNNCAGAWVLTIHGRYLQQIYKNCNLYHKTEQCKRIIDKLNTLNGVKANVTNYPKELFKGYRKIKGREDRPNAKPDYIYTNVSEEYFTLLKEKYPELVEIEYKDFIFMQIKSIDYLDKTIDMVDFEVEDNHNFILEGYVSHNSRVLRLYEAFRLGITSTGTFLSLCSNDDLIKGQSRSVIDIIKSERYGNVFPHLKYDKKDRGFFLKETDGEWKLNQCKLIASYYAKTTNSNVVGIRANLSIDIDDLYADYVEALDDNLNKRYYNTFLTVWRKRYIQNKQPQVIIAGTMWSATDFITRVINLWQSESEFIASDKFKYCKISKDGSKVIIQVPALDYVTGQSTCPEIKSTEELLKEKASMDTYLWETNFQQNPVSPEGLYFDWKNLQVYEHLPNFNNNCSYASLDPARKGKDYVSMPIFKKDSDGQYYLTDALFSQTSMKMLYDDIVDKIITNHIVALVIENNTDTSLKEVIESKLNARGYYDCTIYEKYSTVKKELRINELKDIVRKRIVYPKQSLYGTNTAIGKMMEQVTTFSFDYPNRHDDGIDSICLFGDQIILENAIPQRAVAVKRPF